MMKLSLTGMVGKRPYPPSFWVILLAAPASIIFVGANLWLWQSQIVWPIWLLAKVAIHLIPPFIWLGGSLIVALWLMVLKRLWQTPSV